MPRNNYKFVNPYNFIPLQNKKPYRDESEVEDREKAYTGVINYSIRTVTPLFIPNSSNADAFLMGITDHKSYDFFSYNDLSGEKKSTESDPKEPVIPGSEMRGLIRSYYEILTNSCLSIVEDNETLSKRTHEKFKPGLLKKEEDGFYIHPAKLYLMRTLGKKSLVDDFDWEDVPRNHMKFGRQCYIQDRLSEGAKVYFHIGKRSKSYMTPLALDVSPVPTRESRTPGYVLKGLKGPEMKDDFGGYQKNNKHCCHIFREADGDEKPWKVDISYLDKILKIYKDNGDNTYEEYSRNYKAFKASGEDYFPVYYSKIEAEEAPSDTFTLLSPACITRDIHRNTLRTILKSQNEHEPCTELDHLCPACRLFGTVIKGNKGGIKASSIRFTDLHLNTVPADLKSLYLDKVTLPPLSSPKINNMEFYLKRPTGDSWFWTYDYYVDKNGKLTVQPAEVNGRKFYWHQMIGDKIPSAEADNLNSTIRPLRRKTVFSGKLYFDHLTKTELNYLIYLLNAGSEGRMQGKTNGYKLGMGKPLGLGSITIAVDSVELRDLIVNQETRTIDLSVDKPYEDYVEPEIPTEVKRNFQTLTNFSELAGKTVSYPYADDPALHEDAAIYEWFTNNHGGYDRERKKETSMPSSRKDMFYRQYLRAMDSEFVEAYQDGKNRYEKRKGAADAQKGSGGKKNSRNPVKGEEFAGKVIGVNEKGNRFEVEISGEKRKVSVHFSKTHKTIRYGCLLQEIPEGTQVKVRYEGKEQGNDGREYDTWRIIGLG